MDSRNNQQDRQEFLNQFAWQHTVIKTEQVHQIEELLVEYCEIFAKRRFDAGYNTELKIKLTP